jgi:ubiquitin conjugation factor E4 B
MCGDSWMPQRSSSSDTAINCLKATPEHFVDDIMEMLLLVGKTDPKQFTRENLEPVLLLLLYFLRRPWAVTSPHLRAKLGEVLYYVFLPVDAMEGEERWTFELPVDGPHSTLLSTNELCQNNMAPALLLLYGDVEKTGYYEKLGHRRLIMVILKHLWSLPTHRAAFRSIALDTEGVSKDMTLTSSSAAAAAVAEDSVNDQVDDISDEASYFVRFANGLLNETNSLVSTSIELIGDIRQVQEQMSRQVEWSAMTDEQREQITSRHEENEQQARGQSELCLKTLDFLALLTSDSAIRERFLMDELLSRFISMLTNVFSRLTGTKSKELKVENMQKYKFEPTKMLTRVCQTALQFKDFDKFCTTMANDGFYGDGGPLRKTLSTCEKHNLLTHLEIEDFQKLVAAVQDAKANAQNLESLLKDPPDHMIDPLVCELMRDPVRLPVSKNVVDRSTIATHLLNDSLDPFNRSPLVMKDLEPLPELKKEIDDWIRSKGVDPDTVHF